MRLQLWFPHRVFAFFPIIGTMVIWAPLVIYLYAVGQTGRLRVDDL
jgi:predicted PurR-regulated permease PerM